MSITISGPPGSGLLASGATVGATAQRQIFTSGVGVGASPPAAMLGVIGADSLNTSFAGNISGATGTGFVVTNANNVGIGTTSPNYGLHVAGNIGVNEFIYHADNNNRDSIRFLNDRILMSAGNDTIFNYNAGSLSLGKNDQLYLRDGGNVGIGTTGPTAALHLPASSTARASLRIPAGTAPTSPNAGDVWVAGTVIKFYDGTTTKELAFV